MTRDEHVEWCKRRALEYLPADPQGAFASMCSDIRKHPETQGHIGAELGVMLAFGSGRGLTDPEWVRDWINGFN